MTGYDAKMHVITYFCAGGASTSETAPITTTPSGSTSTPTAGETICRIFLLDKASVN
jgi:hypothetical protein